MAKNKPENTKMNAEGSYFTSLQAGKCGNDKDCCILSKKALLRCCCFLNFHHHRCHHPLHCRLILQTTFNFDWHETIIVVSSVFFFLTFLRGAEKVTLSEMQVASAQLRCCLCEESEKPTLATREGCRIKPRRQQTPGGRKTCVVQEAMLYIRTLGRSKETMGKQWFRRCRGVCVVDTAGNRKRAYKDTGSPVYVQDSLQFALFSIYACQPNRLLSFLPLFCLDLDV